MCAPLMPTLATQDYLRQMPQGAAPTPLPPPEEQEKRSLEATLLTALARAGRRQPVAPASDLDLLNPPTAAEQRQRTNVENFNANLKRLREGPMGSFRRTVRNVGSLLVPQDGE